MYAGFSASPPLRIVINKMFVAETVASLQQPEPRPLLCVYKTPHICVSISSSYRAPVAADWEHPTPPLLLHLMLPHSELLLAGLPVY